MRKFSFLVLMLLGTLSLYAQNLVQGQPHKIAPQLVSVMAIADGTFTMDDIEFWIGEGDNQAAVAVQWGDDRETQALVWGYRWATGTEATGEMLLRAVAEADPRFFMFTETGTAYGSTISGLGYDLDGDCDGAFSITKDGETLTSDINGLLYISGYTYDGWKAVDTDDYWQSGWYSDGYWSYWLKNSAEDSWGYSGVGATGRKLTNGCWDGWTFMPGFVSQTWKPLMAAPKPGPEAPSVKIQPTDIFVSIGEKIEITPVFKGDDNSYQWYKDNVAMEGETEESLVIASATTTDAGSYFCHATNSVGEIYTDTITVTVGEKTVTATPIEGTNTAWITFNEAYASYNGTVTIPETIDIEGSTYTVVGIGDAAFMGCEKITAFVFPETITMIGEGAFYGCKGLTSVNLANLLSIAKDAFNGCSSLTTITLGDNLSTVGDAAFTDCVALTSISLPNGIKTVGENAFSGCSKLTAINLGNSLTSLGNRAFYACALLTDITIPETLESLNDETFAGCVALKNVTLGNVNAIGKKAFSSSAIETVTIPASVTSIGDYAFYGCASLNEVIFEGTTESARSTTTASLTTIGQYAFSELPLTSVVLPASTQTIGAYAFYKCTSLSTANLGNIVTIQEYAFADCSALEVVSLGTNLETIGNRAFSNDKKLTTIDVPTTVKSIGDWAFYYCPFPTIAFGEGLESIGSRAFYGAGVQTIDLPNSVTLLDSYAFASCKSLTSAKLGTGITVINDQTFSGCSALTTIECASPITSIGTSAFANCSLLVNLPISESLTTIGSSAFSGCSALETVSIPNSVTSMGTSVFNKCSALKSATIGTGITALPNSTFSNCSALTDVTYSDNLTSIGNNAFQYCSSLLSLPLTDKVTKIGNYAFGDCTNLESVEIPATITSLGTYALQNCAKLKSVNIASAITSLPIGLFKGCKALTIITLPEGLTGYGNYAFQDCTSLTTIEIPDNITSLGTYVYQGCSGLKEVSVGTGVTTIPTRAFYNCSSLEKITFNGDVSKVNNYIFYGNTSLKRIYLKSTAVPTGAGSYTFKNVPAECRVYVQQDLVDTFKETSYWSTLTIVPWLDDLAIVATDQNLSLNNENIPVISATTDKFEFTFNRSIIAEDNIAVALTYAGETVEGQELNSEYVDNILTVTRVGDALTEGVYNIIVTSFDCEFTASFTAANPCIENINFGEGTEEGVITLNPKHLLGLIPVVSPADAEYGTITYSLEGAGESKEEAIASMYSVNYWNPDRIKFNELSGHRVGECKLVVTVAPKDANTQMEFVKEFTIKVVEPDRSPRDYSKGTFILNEEWFGHTNGGMNYISENDEYIYQAYERENPGMSFGATSQYGTIWNDLLIVMSKQAVDGGDPLPGGGRLVIADANTLKRLGSLDDLVFGDETTSSDGRAVAGATPNKLYVGSTTGIYVVDITDPTAPAITGKIDGLGTEGSTYAGQIGDMVTTANYVFAIKQSTGVFVIDVNTDQVVKNFEETNIQGITQSMDGTVWYATTIDGQTHFVPVNPFTLDAGEHIVLPSEIGNVSCEWSAWKSTQFFGSLVANELWFCPMSGWSSSGKFYRYVIGNDISTLQPHFTLDLDGIAYKSEGELYKQKVYGASRYDARNKRLIVMTTENSSSGHYRNNWTHYINDLGEITKSIYLEPYYWFQSMPIFPDVNKPELDNLDTIEISNESPLTVDLCNYVKDNDNIKANIRIVATAEENNVANFTVEGSQLTITPIANGETNYLFTAESNGCTEEIEIAVKVDKTSGINSTDTNNGKIYANNNRLFIHGYNGTEFALYNTTGRLMANFTADSDMYVAAFNLAPGIYVLKSEGISIKVVLK